MPASVRDILLVIKTKEDAQRALNGISNSMRRAAAQADAASARARAAALRAQATQARVNGATVAQVRALQEAARAQDQHAKSIEASQRRTGHLAQSLERVGSLAQTTGLVMVGMGAATVYGLKQAVDVAAAWDKQVRLTYTQVDKRFKPSLAALSAIGVRVARDIAIPFEEVQTALFDVFSSTEANLPQAEALLRSFAKAAVAGNTDVQTASRATIGLMNAFQTPLTDVNKILDIQFQLVQEGVGTYEEWSQRIGLVTPSAVRAGQSIETMAAALATSTRLGTSAARSGTAVARAFDAMSNPKTESKLRKIGVATRDAKGNFRPLVDVLTDWRTQLEKLPKKDRIESILDVLRGAGSTIEARRFLQGILLTKGGLELFQDQIKEFATDKGAFQRAYNEMANGISAKTQLLNNSWMTLKLTLGNALLPTFSKAVDVIRRMIEWFNKLPKGTQETIAKFALLGAGLLVVSGILLIIIGSFITFAGAIAIAGTAILPVSAALIGIGAALAIVVAGMIALGAGLVIAYNKSLPFRNLVNEIKNSFINLGIIVRDFAMTLWNNFSTTVLPALQRLWAVIQSEVLPAAKDFVAWWTANMNPMLQRAGEIINGQLQYAFEVVAGVIDETVIPALKDLKVWWDQNKATILPLVKMLGASLLPVLLSVGTGIAALIMVIALSVQSFIVFARLVKGSVTVSLMAVLLPVRLLIGLLQLLWNWFKKLGQGASQGATQAMNAMRNLKTSITGFFSGAASWLLSAGRNLVMGFVNGIKGMIGSAASAAASAANAAKQAAMSALGIASPSKVFKDIGKDVIRGFTLGVRDAKTLKQLQTAMYRVSRDVIRSINAADIKANAKNKMRARWNKKLASTTAALTRLENKRVALQNRLATAQKSVNDQIKARNELATKIREAISASADITSLDEEKQASVAEIKKSLSERLAAVTQFQNNLRNLAARGFDKTTIAQLASQGVESAGKLVATLAAGNTSDLKEISALQQRIRAVAGETGNNVAGDLYNAGIKAGQGLVKGLQSQIKNITTQMNKIAAALVKAIKKELGIKSPSRVFQKLGVNTAQGYINGYMKRMGTNMNDLTGASKFSPAAPSINPGLSGPGYGAMGGGGTTYVRHYDQKITVNTQEIDPRKTSAELGWELEGRLS